MHNPAHTDKLSKWLGGDCRGVPPWAPLGFPNQLQALNPVAGLFPPLGAPTEGRPYRLTTLQKCLRTASVAAGPDLPVAALIDATPSAAFSDSTDRHSIDGNSAGIT